MKGRLFAALAALIVALPASAWNPLYLVSGSPARWDTSAPVVWNPDGGGMGKLSNAQAIAYIDTAFDEWQGVSTAVITYAQGVQIVDPGTGLPTDVTSANYNAVINANNGQNPIIFDNDRDIFDMLGVPSGVVGFAGVLRISGTRITKGWAVLEGDWFDNEPAGTPPSDPGEVSDAAFRAMLVHEFGHFSGLGHSSVNHELQGIGLPGCPPPTAMQIETMSPYLGSDGQTLEHDDQTGISVLYPAPVFTTDFATIRGVLMDRDGETRFRGGNVILRRDTASCSALYDFAQGMLSGANPAENGGEGSYGFSGLAPLTDHTLFATTIDDGGSYLFPLPSTLGGPNEYYTGFDEDHFGPPDDPAVLSAVSSGPAGGTVGGIDILINNAAGPGAVPDDLQAELLPGSGFDPPQTLTLDDDEVDSASGYSGTAQAAWINRFTPAPEDFPLRIEEIHLMFWHSSVQPGRSIRLLVYTDPGGTGDPANAVLDYAEDATVQFLSTGSFNTFVLSSPPVIESGEFYVGAFDLVADTDTTFIASYDADTPSGRAYLQSGSTEPATYGLRPDRTFMVRAVVSKGAAEGRVQLTWSASCNIATADKQDYAVYEGSIASLSGTPDHTPLTCGTGRVLEYTVQQSDANRFWLVSPFLATREGSLGAGSGGEDRTPAATCRSIDAEVCP